jgi:hypothetical protein
VQPNPRFILTKEQAVLWAKADKIVAATGKDHLAVVMELMMEEEVK